jgi:IclR family KDG regulon transcriptional repressor
MSNFKSASKLLAIMECFTQYEPVLSVGEIAEQTGMPASSVYRYLATLTKEGYIEALPTNNQYALGLKVIELAGVALSRLELRRHGQYELDAMADELKLNANLGILNQGDILHLGFAVRTHVPRIYTVIGRRVPAHQTSMGKAIYAHMPWEEVKNTIKQYGWRPTTSRSLQDFVALEKELCETRQRGFAQDFGEAQENTWCIGAPVFRERGELAGAISVSGDQQLVQAKGVNEIAVVVMRHAEHLSERMGYMGAPVTMAKSISGN